MQWLSNHPVTPWNGAVETGEGWEAARKARKPTAQTTTTRPSTSAKTLRNSLDELLRNDPAVSESMPERIPMPNRAMDCPWLVTLEKAMDMQRDLPRRCLPVIIPSYYLYLFYYCHCYCTIFTSTAGEVTFPSLSRDPGGFHVLGVLGITPSLNEHEA
jgi:hypothetical protein